MSYLPTASFAASLVFSVAFVADFLTDFVLFFPAAAPSLTSSEVFFSTALPVSWTSAAPFLTALELWSAEDFVVFSTFSVVLPAFAFSLSSLEVSTFGTCARAKDDAPQVKTRPRPILPINRWNMCFTPPLKRENNIAILDWACTQARPSDCAQGRGCADLCWTAMPPKRSGRWTFKTQLRKLPIC